MILMRSIFMRSTFMRSTFMRSTFTWGRANGALTDLALGVQGLALLYLDAVEGGMVE